jgi:hypothetical protein
MLHTGRSQARHHAAEPRLVCTPVQDLTEQAGPFDLIVMPNAALNQLAAAARPLRPGGRLLAQILNPATGGTCGFYDPGLPDGAWYVDREFTSDTGQAMTRRRRQRSASPPPRWSPATCCSSRHPQRPGARPARYAGTCWPSPC